RKYRLRFARRRHQKTFAHRRSGREKFAFRRVMGRSQRPVGNERVWTVRRPATALVHRARARRRTRSGIDGRALLGAGPDCHGKIEELIQALKTQYTIVIVTHNMQQAGRVSDFTAFFYLGKLIEFGPTVKIFTNPGEKQTEDYITGRFG